MNEIVELEIQDVAFGGAGVARHEGKVYFVPFTAPGDRVRARVRRSKKSFMEADLVEIITPAADRIPAPCPYFGDCGGCAYQHLPYERQLEIKQRQVEQTLRRVGRLSAIPMEAIVPSPRQYGFRNRIRVHIRDGRAGFYAHGSHRLVVIDQCPIAEAGVNAALRDLRKRALRDGDYSVVNAERGQFFEQTNDGVAQELVRLVEGWLDPAHPVLIDAYCGAGFFAHRLAPRFTRVIGIEENEHAIARARHQASANEQYMVGDVAVLLGDVLAGPDTSQTTLILDPPAAGLAPRVTEMLLAAPPAQIIYVSCDPATLARDLGLLTKRYTLEAVRPLDMFPQTAEVEVAARLRLAP